MNINAHSYETRQSDPYRVVPSETLAETISHHAEVMLGAGFSLEEVPIDHAVLEMVGSQFQGAMRIWLLLQDGTYVWVDSEGNANYKDRIGGESNG